LSCGIKHPPRSHQDGIGGNLVRPGPVAHFSRFAPINTLSLVSPVNRVNGERETQCSIARKKIFYSPYRPFILVKICGVTLRCTVKVLVTVQTTYLSSDDIIHSIPHKKKQESMLFICATCYNPCRS
jgi:hypothetical protein